MPSVSKHASIKTGGGAVRRRGRHSCRRARTKPCNSMKLIVLNVALRDRLRLRTIYHQQRHSADCINYHSTCRCTFDHTYTYINRGSLYLDSSVCTRVHAPTQEWLMRVRCDAIPREAKTGFRSVEFSRYDLGKGAPIPKRLYGCLLYTSPSPRDS